MAFPWIFHANFEAGDNSEWDSESDTDGVLDFPSYRELARFPFAHHAPFSGAYCMRVALAGGSNDATLAEADINIADAATSHFAFDMLIASDFTGTANDTIPILELLGTGPATVVALGIIYTTATDTITLGCGSATTGATPSTAGTLQLERNTWYTIEMTALIKTNNTGTIDVFITKAGDDANLTADIALTSQDHIAVEDGLFGVQDQETTTTGTILFDNFIQDDARVYPTPRYSLHPILTKSGHVFVGPGHIDIAGLLTDEANNVMRVWDTDTADTNATQTFVIELDINGTFTSFAGPIKFNRGCYVQLSGTNPRGEVILTSASDRPGVLGPRYHSDAGVRRWGLQT